MNRRPLSITIISWLFIAVGNIALGYHLLPQHGSQPATAGSFEDSLGWIVFVRVLAVVSGVFMLFGFNWARWLLVLWLAYHIRLSFYHSAFEVIVHSVLFGVILFFLFRPVASAYFRREAFQTPDGHG